MISVIVPVYKAEKYLHRCVDSILAQSYTNFELLLIDDGSPDNCGAICDEYAAKDSRVRVFHKENGGVSSARNLGLDNARGEWVTFVDSDDWISDEFLTKLKECDDADLVIGGCVSTIGWNELLFDKKYDSSSTFPNFLNKYLTSLYLRTPWSKLFKITIITNNHIRFDEKIRYGEDTIFVYQYLCCCESVVTKSYSGYNYLEETGGWILSSRKYKLTLLEIDACLAKVLALLEKLNSRYNSKFDKDSHIATFLSMYSIFNLNNSHEVMRYKSVCLKYMPHLNDVSFYSCCHLYNPVFRGIMELKYYYGKKLYDKGRALYSILYGIFQVAPKKIPFIYKDFYLWYGLIRYKAYFLCDISLRVYFKLKNFR